MRAQTGFPILALLLFAAPLPSTGAPLTVFQTRSGVLAADDFDDAVLDTSSHLSDLRLWRPLYADSSLQFRESGGFFQVYGNTGGQAMGQHRGIETNPYAYRNWEFAALDTLDLVSIVDMWNLDPESPALDSLGVPAVARMTHHFCSHCSPSDPDHNGSISVGYLLTIGNGGTGPGWDPSGGKWGFRAVWDLWSNRYLSATEGLFGGEAEGFMPTKMEGHRFGPLLDSSFVTGSVLAEGAWVSVGGRAMEFGQCRKVELKSMCQFARYQTIDYRWDNFRLFLRPERWPVRFALADADSVDLTGDYVLVVERESDGALVDQDTLGASSEFAIRLDLESLVIPETLRLRVLRDFTEPMGTVLLPASGVDGCYPDDAYVLYLDTSATATGLAARGGRESSVPVLAPIRPNPCRPSAPITFTISGTGEPTPVVLAVYDVRGRLVRSLLDETIGAGPRDVIWDGYDGRGHAAPPGVYAIRLESPARSATERIVLVR